MDMNLSKLREMVKDKEAWGHTESKTTEWLDNQQQSISLASVAKYNYSLDN